MAFQLSDQQLNAVATLKRNKICLFSGPPGSGKTTTLAHWLKTEDRVSTVYLAPTGKAAQRMSEAFAEAGLSATGQTVHSALHPLRSGHDGEGWIFRFGLKESLPVRRIVVDECSMIDLSLMRCLLDAADDKTQVILTGDPNQLPPVGGGKPFLDMINAGTVPHARLTEVHRFAGRGAQVCQDIMRGDPPVFSKKLNLEKDASPIGPENILHFEKADPARAVQEMLDIIDRIGDRDYDVTESVQVICFRNNGGLICREHLNTVLQNHLNPKGFPSATMPFRIDDRVMCLRNQMLKKVGLTRKGPDFKKYGRQTQYVANGETGIVTYLDDKQMLIKFPRSEADVHFTAKAAKKNVALAYCITCHKSQGGGWPVVIYMIDPSIKCDRSLLYTAISRFKEICVTIGQKAAINRQVRLINITSRFTLLSERLGGRFMGYNDEYMKIENVTQIKSTEQYGEYKFNDRPSDKPEWVPFALLDENSLDQDGETGTLIVQSWFAIRKLNFLEEQPGV